MAVLYVTKKSLEVVLMLCGVFMLLALKGSVFDIGAAVFAPVFGLPNESVIHSCRLATGKGF